jgi:hypothetical protein
VDGWELAPEMGVACETLILLRLAEQQLCYLATSFGLLAWYCHVKSFISLFILLEIGRKSLMRKTCHVLYLVTCAEMKKHHRNLSETHVFQYTLAQAWHDHQSY